MNNEAERQRGRADAGKGKYEPPQPSILDTVKDTREKQIAREHYREGHGDKTREMKKN